MDYGVVADTMLTELYDRVKYLNSDEKLQLSTNDKMLLRVSWNTWVAGDAAQKGFDMFVRMFKNNPETMSVFSFAAGGVESMQGSTKLLFHTSRVCKNISKVVDNIDNLENVYPMLKAVGGRHGTAGYNVPSEYFPKLGVAMRQLMADTLNKQWTPQHEQLWTTLFDFIVKAMVAGQKEYGAK